MLSTGHYKRYNRYNRYPGVKIVSIRIPHITVADDLAILAEDKSDSQVMVWDVDDG